MIYIGRLASGVKTTGCPSEKTQKQQTKQIPNVKAPKGQHLQRTNLETSANNILGLFLCLKPDSNLMQKSAFQNFMVPSLDK